MNLDQLDQKLWVALACPLTGLEFDAKTAALIDTDLDGRIRAPELIAAVQWAGSLLKNPDDLITGSDSLPLAAINDASPEGKQILAAARQILANLGHKEAADISVADASDGNKIFAGTLFNGDGVIIPESAGDEATRGVISAALACLGAVTDRSGQPGIDQAKADAFFAECAAFDSWMRAAEKDPAIPAAGEGTAAAAAAVNTIKGKVDDYFGRCRLAAFDPRAAALVNRKEEDYASIVAKDLSINVAEVAGFPLAQVAAGQTAAAAGSRQSRLRRRCGCAAGKSHQTAAGRQGGIDRGGVGRIAGPAGAVRGLERGQGGRGRRGTRHRARPGDSGRAGAGEDQRTDRAGQGVGIRGRRHRRRREAHPFCAGPAHPLPQFCQL